MLRKNIEQLKEELKKMIWSGMWQGDYFLIEFKMACLKS
jgi:hypothetical protein